MRIQRSPLILIAFLSAAATAFATDLEQRWSAPWEPQVRPVGCDSTDCHPAHCDAACHEPACECAPACDGGCDHACDGGSDHGCDGGCDGGCDSCGHGCNCYLCGPSEPVELCPSDGCHSCKIGGWVQFGYHDKQIPLSQTFGDGLSFNDVSGRFNNHQSWLYIEREAAAECGCWDWGYRADFVYGTDAQKTQAFGGDNWDNDWDHGVYGWALPQLYVDFATEGLSIRAGHFYTLVGYEVVTAPDNFFYSHALTMFNSEPFTHTGAYATYSVCEDVEVYFGWTLGWDTGFEQFAGGSNFLGGFSAPLVEDVQLTYIVTAGDFGRRGDDAYAHSIVLDFTLSDHWNYVVQSDVVRVGSTGDDEVGVNQYLFYRYNDCLAFGTRFEWWSDEGNSYFEAAFGVNIRPHANFIVRPEVRRDWQPGNDFAQTAFGVDMIMTY